MFCAYRFFEGCFWYAIKPIFPWNVCRMIYWIGELLLFTPAQFSFVRDAAITRWISCMHCVYIFWARYCFPNSFAYVANCEHFFYVVFVMNKWFFFSIIYSCCLIHCFSSLALFAKLFPSRANVYINGMSRNSLFLGGNFFSTRFCTFSHAITSNAFFPMLCILFD